MEPKKYHDACPTCGAIISSPKPLESCLVCADTHLVYLHTLDSNKSFQFDDMQRIAPQHNKGDP